MVGQEMSTKTKPKRKSKYDELFTLPPGVTPEDLAKTVFAGKPKPKGDWRYLKKNK